MGQSNKSYTKHTRAKIIVGYVLLLALVVVAFGYVFGKVSSFVKPSDADRESVYKLQLVGEISSELYHAETLVNTASIKKSSFEEYDLRIDTVKTKIEILRTLDPELDEKLDSLEFFMDKKSEILKQLVPFSQQSYVSDLYRKNFEQFLESEKLELQDQLLQKQTRVKTDTVQFSKPAKRRGFFKRLSELFSGQESDTTVRITSSEITVTDSTLLFYNPVDSLNKLIDNIHDEAKRERCSFERMLVKRIDELKKNEAMLTNKLKETLLEIENKEVQNTLDSISEKREALSSSAWFVLAVLAVALLLVFVLAAMIQNDLSKSKRYRLALEEANAQTLELLDSREKLTMGITHDIKAPLSSIIGYIELLSNSKLNDRQKYYLENMKGSSEHILRLVSDILEFNKLETGKISLNCVAFNERKLFEEIAESFRPVAEKKGLEIKFAHNSLASTEMFLGDPLRIRQIASNLLSNAIKFTEKGEVALSVDVSEGEGGANLIFSVSDTGMGIKRADFDKIFQEYVRVDNVKTDRIEGFGLGLSITKRLVDLHNGDIKVASFYGKGSTFTVSIPLDLVQKEAVEPVAEKKHTIKNALIVDDDKFHLTMLEEMLRRDGIDVTACDNPFGALKLLENKLYDIVFTDIQMPGMNGFEFVKQLRNSHVDGVESVTVVALSARADISENVFVEHGFTTFLNKPFSSEQLLDTIKRYFDIPQNTLSDLAAKSGARFDKVLSFASGDKEAECVILNSFVTEGEKNVKALSLYLENGELESAGSLAHKMLALFRLAGDGELVAWLTALENGEQVGEHTAYIERINQIIEEGRAELAQRQ